MDMKPGGVPNKSKYVRVCLCMCVRVCVCVSQSAGQFAKRYDSSKE